MCVVSLGDIDAGMRPKHESEGIVRIFFSQIFTIDFEKKICFLELSSFGEIMLQG